MSKKKVTCFYLEEEIDQKLNELKTRASVSKAYLINMALKGFLRDTTQDNLFKKIDEIVRGETK